MNTESMAGMREFIIGLALRAGHLLIKDFRTQPGDMRFKAKRELVTKLDVQVNDFIVKHIKDAYPNHAILSEERGAFDPKKSSQYMWVVDPLDGTVNYTMRNTFFATNLAVLKDGEPILGVVYAPFTRELFVAEKGKGARKNEQRMHVSDQNNLKNGFLTFGYAHSKKSLDRAIKVYKTFETEARSTRHFGSSSLELAFVACGRVEAQIITPPVRLWDIAAGILLIKEAGGRVTNFKGKEKSIPEKGLIASNGKVHNQIIKVLKQKRI